MSTLKGILVWGFSDHELFGSEIKGNLRSNSEIQDPYTHST